MLIDIPGQPTLSALLKEEKPEPSLRHFHAPANWINDPNGFIYYNGLYHMFYQYFPYGKRWGTMHWGHAISKDMLSWQHLPIALHPSIHEDRNGCFSGSAVEKDGKMHLFYTGVHYQTINPQNVHTCLNEDFISSQLHISSKDGFTFHNFEDKEVYLPTGDGTMYDKRHTRDPKVWKEGDAWYMVVGSTIEDQQGKLLFLTSKDLHHWSLLNTYTSGNPELGWMWECPDLLQVDGKRILIFSPMGYLFEEGCDPNQAICVPVSFDPQTGKMEMLEEPVFFDQGLELYAPQSTVDENGRPVIFAWLRQPETDDPWIGQYCYPRSIYYEDGSIRFRPHENVMKAFRNRADWNGFDYSVPFMAKLKLGEGQEADLGGLKIRYIDGVLSTDRSELLNERGLAVGAQARLNDPEAELILFGDQHIFELFANDGKQVISQFIDSWKQEEPAVPTELYV